MLEQFAKTVVSFTGLEGALADSLEFFIADTIQVTLLLIIAIFFVSLFRTFVTKERIRKILGGKKEGVGNILAALLGIPTPFCSCSAVPLFIGFVESGVPLGVTFSFLVASPMINEIAAVLLWSLFGWEIMLLYIFTGLLIAVIAGIIIGRLGLEGEIQDFAKVQFHQVAEYKSWKQRFLFAKYEVKRIVKGVFVYIIIGVGVGSLIHGFVPQDFFLEIAGPDNILAVPFAVIAGIPLYSNAAGTIPIIEALVSKGMSIGTALALMMSITAISFPELILLKKVLKPKLLGIFVVILFVSFVITGLLYNILI